MMKTIPTIRLFIIAANGVSQSINAHSRSTPNVGFYFFSTKQIGLSATSVPFSAFFISGSPIQYITS